MKFGIIGGSGLYDLPGLKNLREEIVETPYGSPSTAFILGDLEGQELVFLARHGKHHSIAPHELNHRANIWALKKLGVATILSFSAVGSFKEEIKPRDFVLVDQYIDKTKRPAEQQTFFGNGAMAHVSMAHPSCELTAKQVWDLSEGFLAERGTILHRSGTYLNMEGPAFSTKAESLMHKSWGVDLIGMTNYAEAKLAREAQISYLTIAMVTDYDCWHETEEAVTVEAVIANLMANAGNARDLLVEILPKLNFVDGPCQSALKAGLLTPIEVMSDETKTRLAPLLASLVGRRD